MKHCFIHWYDEGIYSFIGDSETFLDASSVKSLTITNKVAS